MEGVEVPKFILNAPSVLESIFSRKVGRDISNCAQDIFKIKSSDTVFVRNVKKACAGTAQERFTAVSDSYKKSAGKPLSKEEEPGKAIWEDILSTLIIEVLWELSLKESVDKTLGLYEILPSRKIRKNLPKELFKDNLEKLAHNDLEALILAKLGVNF